MEPKRDLAIVLKTVVFEERHRIVTALTEEHGKIQALARNSIQSRRFGGALDPFTASLWHFVDKPGAPLARLEEAHARRSYENLRGDFERLSMASVFNELMLRIAPEREPCPELFKLHANALASLDEMPGSGADVSLLNAYLGKALQWSGMQPRLGSCLLCQTPVDMVALDTPVTCLVADAGWICSRCRVSDVHHVQARGSGQSLQSALLRTTPLALTDALTSMGLPIKSVPHATKASKKEHQELFKFLEALLIYHTPGFDQTPLKGLRFLGLESSLQPQSASQRPKPVLA